MRYPKRGIHIDFHTMPNVPDVGADFDADQFVATLRKAHVDFVNVFVCQYYDLKLRLQLKTLR